MPTIHYTPGEHDIYQYVCPDGYEGQWPDQWFNSSWYHDNERKYDDKAHHGPVNPPRELWDKVCVPHADYWSTRFVNMRAPLPIAQLDHEESLLDDPLANMNSQAGQMDWQAFGASITAAITFGIGLLFFLLWAILRKRIPAIYSPTSWFRPPGSRPKKSKFRYSLMPFRRLPSLERPTSEANVWVNMTAGTLMVSFSLAVFALAVYLPLCIVGVPHLNETAPGNNRGGRLGALTDLTFTRLTDGLNPAPSSPQGQDRTFTRANARARIIAVLGAMLFNTLIAQGLVWYTYHKLFIYSMRFDAAAGSQDMVFIDAKNAPAWVGLPEKVIQRNLLLGAVDGGTVAGVFAVPNTTALRALTKERAHVLDVLESAEYKLIMSHPTDVLAAPQAIKPNHFPPAPGYEETISRSAAHSPPPASDLSSSSHAGKHGSAFRENERENGGHPIQAHGDRDRITKERDSTFYSIAGNGAVHGYTSDFDHSYPNSNLASKVVSAAPTPLPGTPAPLLGANEKHRGSTSGMIIDRPYDSASRPTEVSSELAHLKVDIAWARTRLRTLNADIALSQKQTTAEIGAGTNLIGWILVGRGCAGLPFAEIIPGRSKDEIIWENLGKPHRTYLWLKRMVVTYCAAILCIPFLGLGLASAPGVSWYLGFLAPLARHNGPASGVAEGWASGLGVSALLIGGIFLLLHFTNSTNPISWVIHRNTHTEASFRLLRTINMFWLIVIAALEFAIASFASGVGEVRSIGDGIVYMNWLTFIMMCNLSVIVPGLVYIQPLRLGRYLMRKNNPNWQTPRQKFRMNYPPDFNPVWAVAPGLAVLCQASALGPMFPLHNCPALVVTYLLLTAHSWLTKHVYHTSRGGPVDAQSAIFLWTKLSGAISNQPLIMGIVLMLGGQFEIGGGCFGLFVLLQFVTNISQGMMHKRPVRKCFPEATAKELAGETHNMDEKASRDQHPLIDELHNTDHGLTRLPPDNPLPFPTDKIDDLMYTERASHASPEAAAQADVFAMGADPVYGHADVSRGLIYPPELLAPPPAVWLPRDGFGVAQREAASLAADGFDAVIDPVVRRNKPQVISTRAVRKAKKEAAKTNPVK